MKITQGLIGQVCEIAQSAGDAIMQIYEDMRSGTGTNVLLQHKSDDSPLTRADVAAHRVIADLLAHLTPDIAVVSEEDAASLAHRKPEGDFWLIDPLDGTKEFLAQGDEFTVNIALVRDGRPIFGVVSAPALMQTYWGASELGAHRKSDGQWQPIQVSVINPAQPLRVVASKSHMNQETTDLIARLGTHELVQAGSSLKFCRVAEGLADVYPRLGLTCEWDTAAAQAVLEAAGGHVCMLDGTPLHYGKPDVLNPYFVASNVPLAELVEPE